MDTRFKVVFLIAVLVMCSLPIMGIFKGPPLPIEEPKSSVGAIAKQYPIRRTKNM